MDDKFSITHKEFITAMNSLMSSLEDKLIIAVENKIETKLETKLESKVNGRIKEVKEKVERLISLTEERHRVQMEHGEKLDEIQNKIEKRIDPLIEKARDREGWSRIFKSNVWIIVSIGSFIGALILISQFITKIGN